jgi:hypothetical protein
MKKIILLILLITSLTSFEINNVVYVCGDSKIYHPTKVHNSFNNCNQSVIEMSESAALNAGKRICKCKR